MTDTKICETCKKTLTLVFFKTRGKSINKSCIECSVKNNLRKQCEHGKRKERCEKCGIQCDHGIKKESCKECGTRFCSHKIRKDRCKQCQ